MAVHIALTLTFVESIGLGLLLLRVRGVPGLRLLVGFLFGVAVWVLSCELPVWIGPSGRPLGEALIGVSALTSSVFVHFVLVLCDVLRTRLRLALVYGVGGATCLVAMLLGTGSYQPWLGFESFFFVDTVGWVVGIVWALMGLAGHLVMAWAWWQRRGPPRGQLMAMCLASGWGLVCMSGYAFAPVGIQVYPFPLLLLPAYPLILVYGILRYELMIVNAWARRGLAWALVVGIGSALVIAVATLPLPFGRPSSGWELWLISVITLLAAGLLLDPFRRLATCLVYPGSQLGEGVVDDWREQLSTAESREALALIAEREISRQLRLDIRVLLGDAARSAAERTPTLHCVKHGNRWKCELLGWEAAPPGPRYVAQIFGTVLADAMHGLEQAVAFADRERERQKQERLAELGALAATVAHDIRNPLNIIGMAAAMAPPAIREEIATQTARISQLATDLLDYAKSWQVEKRPLDLADQLRAMLGSSAGVELDAGLQDGLRVDGDSRRLQQALINLVDNARDAVRDVDGGRVRIEASRDADGSVCVYVCDNGRGVPAEIRDTLFQPFVSRRPGGTGLGLAIVAKIMLAHGGSATLDAREPWATCFTLRFPPPVISP
ncbi:hypothetical protein B1810_23005 [Panacagrimonas perspica]|nr:hypothetical protein B1810_23005 [Panacagrimonas perspica]